MQIIVKGQITDIFPPEIYGNFEKRVAWVVELGVQYPNTYQLEFHQGYANTLDNFLPGDVVECKVDVIGRSWSKNGKNGVMNTLKCWNIVGASGGAKPTPSTRQQTGGIPPQTPPQAAQDGYKAPLGPEDDLPF